MAHHKIELDVACEACKATGLYVGIAERDGAAVVCCRCRGTGKRHHVFEYDDFEGRQPCHQVRRVFEINPGVCIGMGNGHLLEDFGGIPVRDWEQDKPFPAGSENRRFTCPAWWYQTANYKLKPQWQECHWGTFSSCSSFPNKERCWERWDKEFGTRARRKEL